MKFLPAKPNLHFLRREALQLKSRHHVRDTSVCHVIGHFDTAMQGLVLDDIFFAKFSILDAQRLVAHQYCFSSWARLKLFIQKTSQPGDEFNSELRTRVLQRKDAHDALLKHCRQEQWKNGAVERWDSFSSESGEQYSDIYQRYGWQWL